MNCPLSRNRCERLSRCVDVNKSAISSRKSDRRCKSRNRTILSGNLTITTALRLSTVRTRLWRLSENIWLLSSWGRNRPDSKRKRRASKASRNRKWSRLIYSDTNIRLMISCSSFNRKMSAQKKKLTSTRKKCRQNSIWSDCKASVNKKKSQRP